MIGPSSGKGRNNLVAPHLFRPGGIILKFRTIAIALLFVTVTAIPAGAAEGPLNGTCDDSGRLVCAGADVGANVNCSADLQGNAACSWTYGWITTAFSPLGLPGDESHTTITAIEICDGSGACSTEERIVESDCSWGPLMACDDSTGTGDAPEHYSTTLAVGECVTVTVQVAVVIDASVVTGGPALAAVHFENDGGSAGTACLFNNGRD